jgi:hypothetical protein
MSKRIFFLTVIAALLLASLPLSVTAQDGEGPAQVGASRHSDLWGARAVCSGVYDL